MMLSHNCKVDAAIVSLLGLLPPDITELWWGTRDLSAFLRCGGITATSGKFGFCAAYRAEVRAGMQNLLARSRPLNNYQGACSSSPNVKDFWAKFQICGRVNGSLW